MQAQAHLKYNRRSASKVRQVLGLIRGKSVPQAQQILKYCQRGATEEVSKLLKSAVANAEFLHSVSGDQLFIKEAIANEAPTIKRIRPRARGKADRVLKRNSHVSITVASLLEQESKAGKVSHISKSATSKSDERAKRIAASKKADEKKTSTKSDDTKSEEKPEAKKAPAKKAASKKAAKAKEVSKTTEKGEK
jgi:large subunit ribosomal protein L22